MSATSDAWPIYQPTSQAKPLDAIVSHVARGGAYVVANVGERATLIAALANAGQPAPSVLVPLYTFRADAAAGYQHEFTTDGVTWWPIARAPEPPEADTGWLDGGTGSSIIVANSTNFTLTDSRARKVGNRAYIYIAGTLKIALSVPNTGDTSNTQLGTMAAAYVPGGIGPAQGLAPGNSGRMLAGSVYSSGTLNVTAAGGSVSFAVGDGVSLSGSYVLG